jgi:isopentenyl diphosphate isomerase/L-lactate dehydrogenase-like FMN-dependent dehydrogenase
MTRDYLARIREVTSMQIVVKGIVTREDAACAVAAGDDAGCIGQTYLWGLAAFGLGRAGVENVLKMLKGEPRMVMGQVGAASIEQISATHIGRQ